MYEYDKAIRAGFMALGCCGALSQRGSICDLKRDHDGPHKAQTYDRRVKHHETWESIPVANPIETNRKDHPK